MSTQSYSPDFNPKFNEHTSMGIGEYLSDSNCPKCGSPIRNAKTDACASCPKIAAANTRAKGDLVAKRHQLELERELKAIERDLCFDLLEY